MAEQLIASGTVPADLLNKVEETATAAARKPKSPLRAAGNAAVQAEPDESQFTRFT